MPNKKHYWTPVFIVTTGLSCGIGFVCGFGAAPFYGWSSAQCHPRSNTVLKQTKTFEYDVLERALVECASPAYGPNSPLTQPGAKFLTPYSENGMASFPYRGMAVQGKNLRMEGVPEAGGSKNAYPRIHKSTRCTSMDATPIAIGLPMGILALLLAFRKKLF